MKKILLSLTSLLLLTSCSNIVFFPPLESESINDTTESEVESETNSDLKSETESESESKSESESESLPPVEEVSGTVELYGINDFHGAINPTDSSQMGILKLGSYLKERKQSGNSVIINSGDYWQGTLESNLNKGCLLTEISNEIEFDAMTIGNHEFDWGDSFIRQNALLKSDTGYSTPILASNIYNYDISNNKVLDHSGLGDLYTISQLDNGIKVGIIGYIGPGQISSITSNNVDHLSFEAPFNIIKNLSKELRQKGCHVIVLSGHEDADTISSLTSGSDKITNYVDAIFGAHTHEYELFTKNGIPCVQAIDNGEAVGKIVLEYNSKDGVTFKNYEVKRAASITVTTDSDIQKIYNKYIDDIQETANQHIATFSYELSRAQTSNLMVAALADYALENDIDVSYTLINNARTALATTEAKYTDIYKSYCFDNVVYIAEVNGSNLNNELKYGYFYRLDPKAIDVTKRYKIAVIDYVLLHRNDYREYDNFKNFTILDQYKKTGIDLYTYREVCVDFLLGLGDQVINTNYFSSNNNRHNSSYLLQNVTLADNPYVKKGA